MTTEGDPFSLAGKRILVTGASSGIGRQIAISCAQMGAQLVISGRNSDRLQVTYSELEGEGHSSLLADLTQPDDVECVASEAGLLNGVVHAAGIAKLAPFRLISQAHLNDIFANNVFAPILLTKALLSKKRLAANGSILWISAIGSHVGPLATGAYSASKGALLGAMRTLALEVAKQGIRANCIAPGYVRTPMLENLNQSGGDIDSQAALTPLGLGQPEDIAYTAIYFLSDASRWVTRDYFVVDGGLTVAMDVFA